MPKKPIDLTLLPGRRKIGVIFSILAAIALITVYIMKASSAGHTWEGCLERCSTSNQRETGPMRVLSLNMLHGFPKFDNLAGRVAMIAGEIKRLDADVVLLQEVPWTWRTGNVAEKIAREVGYNFVYYRANGNRRLILFEEGEAILSRYSLSGPIFSELEPKVSIFENRVVLGATAMTPWGEMRVYVTHLTDKGVRVGEVQAEDLLLFVEGNTESLGIVAGDFNAPDDSKQIKELSGIWMDTYRMAHPGDEGQTCCIDDLKAEMGEPLEERIDYIFLVNMKGQLTSAEHAFYTPFKTGDGWQWVSDHTGLMVEIEP